MLNEENSEQKAGVAPEAGVETDSKSDQNPSHRTEPEEFQSDARSREREPTLRDMFAAMALSTTCAALPASDRAVQCYEIADAMIKARG